ncbi:PREDICTED: LOC110410088 isoform [Prunus dulcis]|uniref:PREDICTED: LOC110410088 isoform n=1 Tax=Prunus dulcis TaxID=3755 RepID=A0A5E4FL68_PRUDU|nr:uncharacterized protein LOC117621130 isoform X1 [Prunus dulcis]KAI5340054.1 hypothetical protein L3X38_019328 [Prunus dulcis]VVA26438.1 PREDICTED: LOC110410088 isoform [Prunus dulcis]
MEFKSYKDDAWYDVRIETESNGDSGGNGRRLRVKFSGFADEHDEVVDGKDLKSFKDVDFLRCRFRPISVQLQDTECSQVHKGLSVCAAHSAYPDDRRFYDAVVDGVVRNEHRFENGEEQCTCSFILSWKHGPYYGSLSEQALENICRIQPPLAVDKLDPLLASFLNSARKTVQATGFFDSGARSQRLKQETKLARSTSSHLKGDDVDIGGVPHMIIIDNLEKGISPLTIMEFIHHHLSFPCQAFVSPSRVLESYARGAILLHSKRNVDKLSAFLENPDHIIISSRGRPWLMTEKTPVHDTHMALIETFRLTSQNVQQARRTGTCNELKVVISGTKEYSTAKQLKDLFERLANHICKLHQRLVVEEGRILQLPDEV